MRVIDLGWLGVRTPHSDVLAAFYQPVLGLALVHREDSFWVFETEAGAKVEVFGPRFPGKDHFSSGPVVGFAVVDLDAATAELEAAKVELLGEGGPTWQHFRGPDGNVHELVGERPGKAAAATAGTDALSRGLAARDVGRLEDALAELREAVEERPEDGDAWYWLALTQDNLGHGGDCGALLPAGAGSRVRG